MRETSSSSLTLLNVTNTAPLRKLVESQQKSLFVVRPICRSSVFRGIKPAYFLLIVTGLLFLNIESCIARRHSRSHPRLRPEWQETGLGSQYASNSAGANNGYQYSNGNNNNEYPSNQEDLSGVVVDQKDTEIETIRFGNPEKISHSHGHSKHKHHGETKHKSVSSNDMRGNDGGGDYLEREPLQNNDVQKIGLSTQALKSLAEQVADSILVEADKLHESLKRGIGGGAVAGGQVQVSDSDVGSFVICDDTIRKI